MTNQTTEPATPGSTVLSPCPFCKHSEHLIEMLGLAERECRVACTWCGARGPSHDYEPEAVYAWNTRSAAPEAGEQRPREQLVREFMPAPFAPPLTVDRQTGKSHLVDTKGVRVATVLYSNYDYDNKGALCDERAEALRDAVNAHYATPPAPRAKCEIDHSDIHLSRDGLSDVTLPCGCRLYLPGPAPRMKTCVLHDDYRDCPDCSSLDEHRTNAADCASDKGEKPPFDFETPRYSCYVKGCPGKHPSKYMACNDPTSEFAPSVEPPDRTEAVGVEPLCETCGHLGITPEGWCVDCDWRTNGIKVAFAYRARTPPSASGVAATADELEALEVACTPLQERGEFHIYRDGKTYTRAQCNGFANTLRSLRSRLGGGK